jgi:hypothetical protein
MNVFTDLFRTELSDDPTIMDTATLKLVLFRQAPTFSNGDSRYTGITTKASLLATSGWLEASATGYPLAGTLSVGVLDVGLNHYVMFTQFPFTGMGQAEVAAAAVQYVGTLGGVTDPIILITDTPFGVTQVVSDGDGITAVDDQSIVGASKKWMLSWADAPSGSTTITSLVEGPLVLYVGAPTFEPSHTQHVWLYPQRANMVANPSFEKPGTDYWSTNGAITRVGVTNPVPNQGAWAGQFTDGGTVVAESNTFPTYREEFWTVQFLAKGTGQVKVGFVWWDDAFEETSVDWGTETWTLQPDGFIHIAACRNPVQTFQGMVRIECDGGDITIDNVLCEKGYLREWAYFDGDSTYGARDDYSWYGGSANRGASYSFWYNNKRALYGRLFSRDISDDTLITDEVMAAQGFVYRWVPAGTFVVAHIDVLHPNDIMASVPPKPAGVLPYRVDVLADLDGVINPWP